MFHVLNVPVSKFATVGLAESHHMLPMVAVVTSGDDKNRMAAAMKVW
jgi:hypothetical protein